MHPDTDMTENNFSEAFRRNEELYNSYASPDIIRVNKSRRMRWAGHVARMEAMVNASSILVGNMKGRVCLEDLGLDDSIVLERILRR
jgi:ribosomal protein S5